ncbi:YdgH/BhsA/McbA-like domain containing protein, partial [Escherichia coli]
VRRQRQMCIRDRYYHITRQWQERGNNLTVSADLYK